jgi:glycosyltransferase involved in cell wall biosynthesis
MQKVSIVIPTFNSSKYLKATLDSVLSQTYTNWECILVDDGSIDLTGTISVNYQEKDNRFQLYKRPVDLPKGPSSARNYGVSKAKGDYLIFLDADDFYLENRFENDIKLFESDSSIDGVYNAIGVHFYRNATEQEKNELNLTTVRENILPVNLFEELLSGKKGYFSIDGLVVKKQVFEKIGYFNEELLVAEDTELILKMTLRAKLVTGIIDKPVCLRGVHDVNSFSNEKLYKVYRIKMYDSLLRWIIKEKIAIKKTLPVLKLLFYYRLKYIDSLWEDCVYWMKLALICPKLLGTEMFIKNFPLISRRKIIFKRFNIK